MSGGGKGGKGGGSSATVDMDVSSNSSNIIDSTTALTSSSNLTADTRSQMNSQNSIDSNAQATLQIAGLDNIRLRADTTSDSKTALDVDLKPLQVDLCLKVGLDRLPATRICRPTHERFGLSFFGVEVLGFSYSKEQSTIIEDGRQRPFVAANVGPYASAGAPAGPGEGGVHIRLGE